jgi:hypothetical protein
VGGLPVPGGGAEELHDPLGDQLAADVRPAHPAGFVASLVAVRHLKSPAQESAQVELAA